MSHRPSPTFSRPRGSTRANGTSRNPDSRIARAKRFQISPYPLAAVRGKHLNKQGFPNTIGKKG